MEKLYISNKIDILGTKRMNKDQLWPKQTSLWLNVTMIKLYSAEIGNLCTSTVTIKTIGQITTNFKGSPSCYLALINVINNKQ